MESQKTNVATRRPRRDGRRDRNRERLVTAAVDLVLREGLAALTPTRITELAGLHKPAFYAHFKSVSDCVAQVVQHIGTTTLTTELEMHREALRAVPYDLAAEQRALEATFRHAVDYRSTYQLMIRQRFDSGPIGTVVRTNIATAVADMTELLWELGLRHGLGAHHLKEVATLAEVLTDHTLVAIVRVVEGGKTDIVAEAAMLARCNDAIVAAEFRRMLSGR
jgi:AcrR family transcriptional regulator